jgi:hypothetical protein
LKNSESSSSAGEHRRLIIAILLIAIAVISIQIGAYYDLERFFLTKKGAAENNGSHGITVNTLLNFGNGTSKWFNESSVPVGWNFYNLTIYIANGNVVSTWDADFHEHYITGIDGIVSRSNSAYYWALWQFCNNDRAWLYSNLGADDIIMSENQTMAWYWSDQTNPPPVAGAKTVAGSC